MPAPCRVISLFFAMASYLCAFAFPAYCQTEQEDVLSGADAHETIEPAHGYLFGDWGGERKRLKERGIKFD